MYHAFINNPSELSEYLVTLQDEKFRSFHAKLVKSEKDIILGIPIPKLRAIAKELAKFDCEKILSFPVLTFEEKAIKGFIIGYSKYSMAKTLSCLRDFVPQINNWAICDTTVSSLVIFKTHQTEGREFIAECLATDSEFIVRYGLVLLLSHYINDDYIDDIIDVCVQVKSKHYYVNMALAWLISACFVHYPNKTVSLFAGKLDKFVQNKSISKIRESYRVNQEDKEKILRWRIK